MPWNFCQKWGVWGAKRADRWQECEINSRDIDILLLYRNILRAENRVFAGEGAIGDFCAILAC